jgi:hypothetical protein
MDKGADVMLADEEGYTAFHYVLHRWSNFSEDELYEFVFQIMQHTNGQIALTLDASGESVVSEAISCGVPTRIIESILS